jgi:hypothetical protein
VALRDQQPEETELQWLKRVLPKEYQEFADVFSKEASNQLPPYRTQVFLPTDKVDIRVLKDL